MFIESEDADNGWVDTHHYDKDMTASDDKVLEMTLENSRVESMEAAALMNDESEDDDEEENEEAADMEEFEESGMLEDDKVKRFT